MISRSAMATAVSALSMGPRAMFSCSKARRSASLMMRVMVLSFGTGESVMVMVTKREAVRSLIRGAMRAHRECDVVCTITLAGAAEEAMPPATDHTIFTMLRAMRVAALQESEAQAGRTLNAVRNWLKHYNVDEVDPVEVSGGVFMIARALTRYYDVYGTDEIAQDFDDFFETFIKRMWDNPSP